MSHLWLRDAEGKRVAHSIKAANHDLRALLLPDASGSSASPVEPGLAARVISAGSASNGERWVVVAGHSADLRVNGIPLMAMGMRVLADRDELAIPGVGSAYFSAEQLAAVVPFPAANRVVLCGRCRQEIKAGDPMVACVGCNTLYHEKPNLNCFTYGETCSFCPTATVLDAGFSWVPEE